MQKLGNHNQLKKNAKRLINEIKVSGANAVKLQTYTPDTMTFNLKTKILLKIKKLYGMGNIYDLYNKAYTPMAYDKRII